MIDIYPFYNALAIAFAFLVLAVAFSCAITRGKKRGAAEKNSIYACGEDIAPQDLNVTTECFYDAIIDTFKVKKLADLHSGDLTEYLFFVCSGAFILMIILVLI